MKNRKNKILAIMQLPPPVHGQTVMNQTIYKSEFINKNYNFKTIPLHFAELGNIRKPSIKKLLKMVYYLFLILRKLSSYRPDLIYFTLSPTGFAFYRDSIYVGLIKLFRVPIVFHLHGKGIKEKAKKPFNRILYSLVFKNSKIILLSKLLKKDIENVINNENCLYYLPNGIRPETHNFTKNNSENSCPVILFLSNIAKTKGVLVLIEAARLLAKKKIKFKIKLVGQIHQSLPKKELLITLSDPSIKKHIEYVGPKYGEKKDAMLHASDIFVFPTFFEAFPLVLLEAMQAALPVVSTFEGAIPEIVNDGDTGFLVKQKDIKDLADKIELLLKDVSLRKIMGEKAKLKCKKYYTQEIFETNLDNIFKSILQDKSKEN